MKPRILLAILLLGALTAAGQSTILGTTVGGSSQNEGLLELGLKFTTTKAVTLQGLRFYKLGTTGAYTLKLYAAGTQVLNQPYTGTATGWVQVPVSYTLQPGIAYTVSYLTPGQYQAANPSPYPKVVGSISASASVYRYGATSATAPTSTFQTSNYYADIVWTEGGTTTPPPDPTPTPTPTGDSVYMGGILYVKASAIKKDTAWLPVYCPDSSWIYMDGWDTVAAGIDTKHIYDQYEISMPQNNRIRWSLYIEKFWRRTISRDGGVTWTEE